ncbi:MAG: UDP-N-acetylmuramoyl-tripeptide--D-alanyl-D-alanine ligase [Clostridia bacterium]|nr:UDP-N-acetylmuramoyl-tripeptide--D-alanyl-D-alanine ligase [Clostridia bacterium]
MQYFVRILGLLLFLLGPVVCTWLILQRSMHMYQLNGYQRLSYTNYLRANRRENWSAKRIVPTLMIMVGGSGLLFDRLWWLMVLGMGLFVLINRPPKAKKPLVYTPRVKRMLVTAGILLVLWNVLTVTALVLSFIGIWFGGKLAGALFVLCTGLYVLRIPAQILLQPWLVMLYSAVNSPMEKAINQHYYNEADRILRDSPNLKIVGITGSYGKTSVKYFLNQLLSVKYNVYMTPGNYNTTLGVIRAVREGLRPTHEIFLCEMGARHVGDIAEICQLAHPDLAIITSIGPQHLETFGSVENIVKTKLELADAVKGRGPVFLNFDSALIAQHAYDQDVVTYGQNGKDYAVSDVHIGRSGSIFTVTAPDGSKQEYRTRLLGAANVQNIAGAVAVAHSLGVSLKAMVPAVRQLEGAPHRLELKQAGDITIIDDAYNSNPAGAAVALETLGLCRGGRIVITPGLVELGDKELEYNRVLGTQAAGNCDLLILVGSQPRTDAIEAGAKAAGLAEAAVLRANTVQDAMAMARSARLEDKMVLLLNDLTDNY